MPSTAEIHWLAGLLEGEGTFTSLRRPGGTGSPVLSVAMTDEDVVRRASRLLGRHGQVLISPPRGKGRKTVYRVQAYAKSAAAWMMMLYPLMGERRRSQIRQALWLWRATPPANGKKTHCRRGHPYDEANTLLERRGDNYILRHCRLCRNERKRKAYADVDG